MGKRILAVAAALLLAIVLAGCSSMTAQVDEGPGLNMKVNLMSGLMSIARPTAQTATETDSSAATTTVTEPAAAQGGNAWTIFVYMCASNLETDDGSATNDIAEMIDASGAKGVRFVVETGGARAWHNNIVDGSHLDRFLIEDGKIARVASAPLANMGKSDTLADFLMWGTTNYPARRMGVILWNHGAGSIDGVCADELFYNDSLTLRELDAAFLSAFNALGDKFEFIGFDACLMSTLETANILASYARYMYGSEEYEPGNGCDYRAMMSFLAKNPDADGAELGRAICDSYYSSCQRSTYRDMVTYSVIDLSAIDDLVVSFNAFSKELCSLVENNEDFAQVAKEIATIDSFGGNNRMEGYTNMVDLGGLVDACSSYVTVSQDVKNALGSAVVYTVSGTTHQDASGLSVYYPLAIQGSQELATFEQVCVSPFYLTFVDSVDSTGASGDGTVTVDYSSWFDGGEWGWTDSYSYDYDPLTGFFETITDPNASSHWSYADTDEPTGESSSITFAEKPHVDEDGYYTFTLDANGINNASSVSAYVYAASYSQDWEIELGETVDVYGSWEDGTFYDGFDGKWLSLPDGQNLATYIAEYCDYYIVYTSPVMLNGKEMYLRFRQYYNDDRIVVEGAWSGIDESGFPSRGMVSIEPGDVITPLYYSAGSDEFAYEGDPYTAQLGFNIGYEELDGESFAYTFVISDLYGDYYVTDPQVFSIEADGTITYE